MSYLATLGISSQACGFPFDNYSSIAVMDRPKTAKQSENSQQNQSDEDLNRGRPASRRGVRTPQRVGE